MKVNELIALLQTMPQDASVVVMDSERSAYEASGDPSPEGLYYDFEVDLDTEMFFRFDRESIEDEPIPTVVISFESDYAEQKAELAALDADCKELEDRLKFNGINVTAAETVTAPKQQCYKGHGACDCPGTCRENC